MSEESDAKKEAALEEKLKEEVELFLASQTSTEPQSLKDWLQKNKALVSKYIVSSGTSLALLSAWIVENIDNLEKLVEIVSTGFKAPGNHTCEMAEVFIDGYPLQDLGKLSPELKQLILERLKYEKNLIVFDV